MYNAKDFNPDICNTEYEVEVTKGVIRRKYGTRYVKVIPWDWLVKAANLNHSCSTVAFVLWFLRGVTCDNTVRLTKQYLKELERMDIQYCTLHRCLKNMHNVGLVEYIPAPNKVITVTIITDFSL